MRGFMRPRSGGWELRVYLGRDPVSGRKRYASKTVRCGRREAERELAAMVAGVEGESRHRSRATVGELLEEWFERAALDFSPKTARAEAATPVT